MMTHTHILVGAALFARPGARWAGPAAFAGAVTPDLDVAFMWISERIGGASSCIIFRERFWESPWVEVQSVMNSAPLWAFLAVIGWLLRGRIGVALLAFGATGLLHVLTDMMLHAEDARAHFQPFTDWRFMSPISYWDPARHAGIVAPVEAIFGLMLVAVLWRRFGGLRVRAALVVAAALYGLTIFSMASSSEREFDHHHECPEDRTGA